MLHLHTDHLGSTSVAYDTDNNTWTTQRYYPYGSTRSGGVPTDRLFTGQLFDGTIGLYQMGVRWYDPVLGRFVQPDSLVQADAKNPTPYLPFAVSYANPKILERWNQFQRSRLEPQAHVPNTPSALDPQFLNRYTYARNNPLAYVDDSGHIAWWIVGGIVGGVVGFGAYAITHRENFDWREAAVWTAGGAVVGGTLGAGAHWVAGALGTEAAVTAGAAATATSPWTLPALQRGQVIHRMLGENLPQNFPVIDRFIHGVATSIKTLNLNAATYQNIGTLTSRVQGYINTLANWQGQPTSWGGVRILANQINSRVLELAIPTGIATQEQLAALQQLQQYAAQLGVTLNIVSIP